MPEDVKPAEEVKTPEGVKTPAFDPEALGQVISKQVAEQVATALQTHDAQPPAAAKEPIQEDALAQVLEPYMRAGSAKATLIAQMAADKADFYTVADADELADRLASKDEVEKRALALAAAGRALPREDIFKHLKGEKFDEFAEKRAKRRKERERVAQEAGDHGADGVPQVRGGGTPAYVDSEAAFDLQGKGKLEEFLDNKAF